MPGKLSITVGIPGSGKTTLAKKIREIAPYSTILVSRDDLRAMLFDGEGILSGSQEAEVSSYQKEIVKKGLRADKHVIVHDTNLKEKYRNQWAKVARNVGAGFSVIDQTGVPLGDCVDRVSQRYDEGGRDVDVMVLIDLHKKFIEPLKGKPVAYPLIDTSPVTMKTFVPRPELASAVMVDIDGTIASHEGVRNAYDASRYEYDVPVPHVVKFVQDQHYKLGKQIVFCSGRHDRYRDVTEEWIYKHVKVPFTLVMREDSERDDSVEKYLIFDKYIRPYFNPEFVLDDRDRVVQMWRSIDLPCFQVNEGDF